MQEVLDFDPRRKTYLDELQPYARVLSNCMIFLYEAIILSAGFAKISTHEAEGVFFKQISADMLAFLDYHMYAFVNNVQTSVKRIRVGKFH